MIPQLNIMGYVDRSEVNGFGRRAVVWLQGCERECSDCFNPASWLLGTNQLVSVEDTEIHILKDGSLTVTGFRGQMDLVLDNDGF